MRFKTILVLFMLLLLSKPLLAQSSQSGGKTVKVSNRLYGKMGFLFDLGIYYGQSEATANPAALNEWQNNTSIYDIKLGYVSDNNIYWGAEYSVRGDNQILGNQAAGNGGGIGIGYFADNGMNFRAFYRLSDKFGDYTDGSGYQADIGYSVNLTSNFFLGFVMSIRQITYKSNSTIVGFDYWTRKETYPMLNLGFLFN